MRGPTPRQIVFNWLMDEPEFATAESGWWGTYEDVERVDALLAALGLPQPPISRPSVQQTSPHPKEPA